MVAGPKGRKLQLQGRAMGVRELRAWVAAAPREDETLWEAGRKGEGTKGPLAGATPRRPRHPASQQAQASQPLTLVADQVVWEGAC